MLSVSPVSDDYAALSGILTDPSWQLFPATTCRDAVARLSGTQISVILCEYSLTDGTWQDVLDYVQGADMNTPIIVTSRLADEHIWAEVLNLGGFDVLAKPFQDREVLHTITSALLYGTHPAPRARAAGTA